MIPVTVQAHISAPREELFDFVADYGARPAWCDHFMKDYRLAHPAGRSETPGARFRVDSPGYEHYLGVSIVELEHPRLVVESMQGGRNGHTRGEITWELTRGAGGQTTVQVTFAREPGTPREQFKEKLGSRRWTARQLKIALERLRVIFEERPDQPLARASVAGHEPLRGPRFGASPRIIRG